VRVVIDGIVGSYQKIGGISRLFQEILPRMIEQDASLEIVLLVTSGTWRQMRQREPRIRGFPQLPWQARHIRGWPFIARRLVNPLLQCAALTADTIWHSTYFSLPPKRDVRTVVTVYDMIPELNLLQTTVDFRQQKRQAILHADRILCISENTRRDVIRLYGVAPAKVLTVWPAYNRDVFNTATVGAVTPPPVDRPYLLYVGQRQGYKNFDLLLQAYAHWQQRVEVSLVVVGYEWTVAEQQRLSRLGLANHVVMLENVSDTLLRDLYRQALAFVYPSLYEGFGLPLLEAMACGCPVIASRIPTTQEIAGDCPVYFSPESEEELRSALDTVLSREAVSAKIAAGLTRTQRYSWDRTAAQTLATYRELAG